MNRLIYSFHQLIFGIASGYQSTVLPRIKEIKNSTIKIKNKTFAIPAAPAAIPPNPNILFFPVRRVRRILLNRFFCRVRPSKV